MSDQDVENTISQGVGDLTLEKKKKKKKPKTEGETNGLDLDLTKKKKKKKEKKDGDNEAPVLDLSDKKKKKKKPARDPTPDGNDDDATGDAPKLNLGTKKPKKDKKDKKTSGTAKERKTEEIDEEKMARYDYETLLFRVFDKMETIGVGKGAKGSKRIVCAPPTMVRIGTKKSGYQNFGLTCDGLARQHKHVMQYILAETGTSGNLDMTNQLILRGRFKPSHMENILREYIREYVQCGTCKSANTVLEKIDRLTFMACNDCSSRRTVLAMTAGYQAVTGKRKKLREKQGMGTGNAMKN